MTDDRFIQMDTAILRQMMTTQIIEWKTHGYTTEQMIGVMKYRFENFPEKEKYGITFKEMEEIVRDLVKVVDSERRV